MKQIIINGKTYKLECNALTYIMYKRIFKRGIFEDIQVIKDYLIQQTLKATEITEKYPEMKEDIVNETVANYMTKYLDDFIEVITRMAYIMIYSANEKIEEYEEWLKNIKTFKIDDDWIVEVAEIAVDCFC